MFFYEVWIRETSLNRRQQSRLACFINDFYDPNDIYSLVAASDNSQPRSCVIAGLAYDTEYLVSASSSTLIGTSLPSVEVRLRTLESEPLCAPRLVDARELTTSDSVKFTWLPTLNDTLTDKYWMNCIGGKFTKFRIFQVIRKKN